mmetsp:Transcript_45803/g.67601  ORF Transcript_45803/g.67601 Transcript_45803/m.67601 type:complete len:214 (-) Transcript_45803:360-1001(-)
MMHPLALDLGLICAFHSMLPFVPPSEITIRQSEPKHRYPFHRPSLSPNRYPSLRWQTLSPHQSVTRDPIIQRHRTHSYASTLVPSPRIDPINVDTFGIISLQLLLPSIDPRHILKPVVVRCWNGWRDERLFRGIVGHRRDKMFRSRLRSIFYDLIRRCFLSIEPCQGRPQIPLRIRWSSTIVVVVVGSTSNTKGCTVRLLTHSLTHLDYDDPC